MQIAFLEDTKTDLRWFKRYYTKSFPAGRENANRQYHTFLSLLKEYPSIGHPVEDEKGVREYSISRTPFSVLYRIKCNRIEIIRIYDERSEFSNRSSVEK